MHDASGCAYLLYVPVELVSRVVAWTNQTAISVINSHNLPPGHLISPLHRALLIGVSRAFIVKMRDETRAAG